MELESAYKSEFVLMKFKADFSDYDTPPFLISTPVR